MDQDTTVLGAVQTQKKKAVLPYNQSIRDKRWIQIGEYEKTWDNSPLLSSPLHTHRVRCLQFLTARPIYNLTPLSHNTHTTERQGFLGEGLNFTAAHTKNGLSWAESSILKPPAHPQLFVGVPRQVSFCPPVSMRLCDTVYQCRRILPVGGCWVRTEVLLFISLFYCQCPQEWFGITMRRKYLHPLNQLKLKHHNPW